MPLYSYECSKCKYSAEYLEKESQKIIHYCGKCNEAMPRVLSPSNFKFNGSGFYVNDYKKRPST